MADDTIKLVDDKPKRTRATNPNATRSYSISLPPLMYEVVKAYAAANNTTVSRVILALIKSDEEIMEMFQDSLNIHLEAQLKALKESILAQYELKEGE